jgi:hypothetical protein
LLNTANSSVVHVRKCGIVMTGDNGGTFRWFRCGYRFRRRRRSQPASLWSLPTSANGLSASEFMNSRPKH